MIAFLDGVTLDGLHWALMAVCAVALVIWFLRFHGWLADEKMEALEIAAMLEEKLDWKEIPGWIRAVVCGRLMKAREHRKEVKAILKTKKRFNAEMYKACLVILTNLYDDEEFRERIDRRVMAIRGQYFPPEPPAVDPAVAPQKVSSSKRKTVKEPAA